MQNEKWRGKKEELAGEAIHSGRMFCQAAGMHSCHPERSVGSGLRRSLAVLQTRFHAALGMTRFGSARDAVRRLSSRSHACHAERSVGSGLGRSLAVLQARFFAALGMTGDRE